MAQAAVAAGPWTDRRIRTAELRRRYMFARELLDFYGALLGVQQRAYEEAISARPAASDLVAYVAEMVVPAVVEVSVAAGPVKLRDAVAHRLETTNPRDFVAAWIRGEDQVMVDRYLARASVAPILEALGPEAAAASIGMRDERHCPSCGGPPQLSYFALAGEDLAAGGRFLLCARCHGSWGYARMTCPGCGGDERELGVGAKTPDEGPAVHFRHHDVGDDQVGIFSEGRLEPRPSIAGRNHFESRARQGD